MSKGTRGWRQTLPLAPLALFACAFGIQAASDDPSVANAAIADPASTAGGVVVPSTPIDSPANFPIPGVVANGVPRDAESAQVVSGSTRASTGARATSPRPA